MRSNQSAAETSAIAFRLPARGHRREVAGPGRSALVRP